MTKFFLLFLTGGIGYCSLEILWRGYTHWTMFLLGGLCFYILYIMFSHLDNYPIFIKAILGGSIITVAELITGCIVNILLKWNVWNYSAAPYNFLGQICLSYSILWTLLSIPIAILIKAVNQYI